MQRRREFYEKYPEAASDCSSEERGEGAEQRFIYSRDERISLSLESIHGTENGSAEIQETDAESEKKVPQTRYLNCPAAFSVANLKKFVALKYSLPPAYTVDIMYADHVLNDDYTLMDIAYIYAWKRAGPMRFRYRLAQRIARRIGVQRRISKPQSSVISNESEVSSLELNSENKVEAKEDQEKMEIEETDGCHATAGSEEVNQNGPVVEEEEDAVSEMTTESSESPSLDIEKMEVTAPSDLVNGTSPNEIPVAATKSEPLSNDTVKVVVSSENTILSTANGMKVKLIHHPELNPKSRNKKTGSRKGGRSSRYKSAPVHRFARLAPYPPPSAVVPVTCPTVTQIAVGNLVPSVMNSLSPNLVTALVTTTSCNAGRNIQPTQPASFLTQQQLTQTTATSLADNLVSNHLPETVSSTAASYVLSTPSSSLVTNTSDEHNSQVITIPSVQHPVNILPPVSSSMSSSSDFTVKSNSESSILQTALSAVVSSTSTTVPSTISKQSDSTNIHDSTDHLVTESIAVSAVPVTSSVLSDVNVSKTVFTSSVTLITETEPTSPKHIEISNQVASVSSNSSELSSVKTVPSTSSSQIQLSNIKISVAEVTPSITQSVNSVSTNGISSPKSETQVEDSTFCSSYSADKKSSDSFKISVKNSISAEFSDNDDLGCQPDLVVDEQKMDSSDNEDDTDAALRKKITAIAEKDDDADATDDTEADSGRASDISSQARSSCDDDIGSPMPVVPTSDLDRHITATSTVTSHVNSFTIPVITTTPVTLTSSVMEEKQTKSNKISNVIDNIYRNHEKKDKIGALDLSTCQRKPGETPCSRPKTVANPVLDIKHRQQAYLPAPNNKQHTACVPAPKHPVLGLVSHYHNLMPSQMPIHGKSLHSSVPFHNAALAFPSQSRGTSSPSLTQGRSTPTYNTNLGIVPSVPSAHQSLGLPNMLPCMSSAMMNYPSRGSITPNILPGRTTPSSNLLKCVSSPPSLNSRGIHQSKQTSSHSRKSDSHRTKSPSPNHRNSAMLSPSVSLSMQTAYSKTSSSDVRLSPHHMSGSPATSPKQIVPTNNNTSTNLVPTNSNYKVNQSSTPIYKKDPYKNYSSKFKGSNLAVFNPDPNGYRQRIVIKNLNFTPQSQKS
ncbi:Polycomb complex protein BMI-1-B, partial [Stegodyphus mimosarum]